MTGGPVSGGPVSGRLVRAVGLPLLVAGALLPFVPLVGWAVALRWPPPELVPSELSSRPLAVLVDPASEALPALVRSLVIAVAVAVLACAVGLPAGRAIGLHVFPGRRALQVLLLAPVLVPGLAVTLGLQVVFLRLGLGGTLPGVVVAHLLPTVPYVTLVMGSVFASYDTAWEQQARSLGAGPLVVLLRVTLPAVAPGLAVAAMFAFLVSWAEYVLTLLIGAGQVPTLPLVLFASLGGADRPVTAALALALVVPPLLLVGLVASAVGRRSSGASAGGAPPVATAGVATGAVA